MGTKRYELTEGEWNRIKDILPPEHPKEGKRGRPAKCDNRSAINGILWIARGGAPWRELPERYGPWQTVYSRFREWKNIRIFEVISKLCLLTQTLKTSPLTQHPAKYIKAPTVGKNPRIKLLVCLEAVGIRRFTL